MNKEIEKEYINLNNQLNEARRSLAQAHYPEEKGAFIELIEEICHKLSLLHQQLNKK